MQANYTTREEVSAYEWVRARACWSGGRWRSTGPTHAVIRTVKSSAYRRRDNPSQIDMAPEPPYQRVGPEQPPALH
jgi:hypothetical protein